METNFFHLGMQMLLPEALKTCKLSAPIVLGEIIQLSIHLTDAAMVGQISYKHLAAAALASSIVNVPFIIGAGITIAFSQLISAARGKDNCEKIEHYLINGIYLCVIISLLLSLTIQLAAGLLTHLHQEKEVALLAVPYLRVLGWSLIPLIIFLALKHFLDGLEMTQVSMLFSIVALPITVLADWLLIYGHWGLPRLELLGAAYGTLISRVIVLAAISVFIVRSRRLSPYLKTGKAQRQVKAETLREFLSLGIPISLQLGTEIAAFALSAIIIGRLGSVSQAAHYIAFSCATFTLMMSLGLAQGSSIRISHAWGQNNWYKISQIAKSTLILTILCSSGAGVIFFVFWNQIILLFNDDPAVVATTYSLIGVGIFFQISNALQVVLSSMLRGIKEVKVATIHTLVAYWLIGIPAGYYLAFYCNLGIQGIWVGFIIGLVFLTFMLSRRFYKRIIKAGITLPVVIIHDL